MPCFIWGTPATEAPRSGDYLIVDSPRAGGRYRITDTATSTVHMLVPTAKLILTTWLCNQRRLGVEVPEITSYNLKEASTGRRLTIPERVDRGLLTIVREVPRVDHKFDFGAKDGPPDRFLAETECADRNEGAGLLRVIEKMGLLSSDENTPHRYQLTPEGWIRYELLTARATDSTQGFVAMWFNDDVKAAYDDGIAPAIRAAGYKPLRIDSLEHNGKVDDRIIAEIRRSRFLVADFSCEKEKARGGVYYEAGFAEGIGIDIFWTVRAQSIKDLHFDTRQYNHIVWTNPADLREKLKNRIVAVLGQGPVEPV